ncbi:MAG TPA: hypothetical protein VFH50_13590 [Acidimicrobiales bacterium]|nr:hypothetical protein [Acidimicrobiales bacterium]
MLVAFVLRLRPDQLAVGRLVGEVEDVESGRQQGLRDVMELVEFCCQAASSYVVGPVVPDGQGSV